MDLNRIEQIFDEWGSLSTSEREAYLDELCGSDAELRAEYERLLAGGDSLEPTLVDERTSRGAAVELWRELK